MCGINVENFMQKCQVISTKIAFSSSVVLCHLLGYWLFWRLAKILPFISVTAISTNVSQISRKMHG